MQILYILYTKAVVYGTRFFLERLVAFCARVFSRGHHRPASTNNELLSPTVNAFNPSVEPMTLEDMDNDRSTTHIGLDGSSICQMLKELDNDDESDDEYPRSTASGVKSPTSTLLPSIFSCSILVCQRSIKDFLPWTQSPFFKLSPNTLIISVPSIFFVADCKPHRLVPDRW